MKREDIQILYGGSLKSVRGHRVGSLTIHNNGYSIYKWTVSMPNGMCLDSGYSQQRLLKDAVKLAQRLNEEFEQNGIDISAFRPKGDYKQQHRELVDLCEGAIRKVCREFVPSG